MPKFLFTHIIFLPCSHYTPFFLFSQELFRDTAVKAPVLYRFETAQLTTYNNKSRKDKYKMNDIARKDTNK